VPPLRCGRRARQCLGRRGERRLMFARGLATAAVVVILDQLSKAAVLAFFAARGLGDRESVTSFFNLALTYNRGISFGLFNGGAGLNALVFSLAAAAIVAVLLYWLSRVVSPFLAVAIGLIIGGAIGNVIDRLRLGAVVDFLDFHVGYLHWPAFNLADSAICIGVAAMLLDGLLLRREAH
jgi:signal peptidase II